MLAPKTSKFRKMHKGNKGYICGNTTVGATLDKGFCGLQALEGARITANQLEAIRVAVARTLKKEGKYYLRIFPTQNISKKAAETRMGGGKGAPDHWVCIVYPGRILFELADVSPEMAKKALMLAATKLGVKTRIVWRIV